MPITINPPLPTVDIQPTAVGPPRTTVGRFHGGTRDGQVMALEEAQPLIRFPVAVAAQAYYTAADSLTVAPQWSTEDYYAGSRTVTFDTANVTASAYAVQWPTATTVAIDYYVIGAGANNVVHGTWNCDTVYSRPLTGEQQAVRARAAVRKDRRRVIAHKRARRLLLNLLSEEQQHEYAQNKTFTVVAKNGKVFRLRKGKTAELLGSDGAAIAAYCIHLPHGYEPEDTLIALLLSLQTDPAEFERVANVTHLQSPQDRLVAAVEGELAAARQDDRWRREHDAEARALLRAEGLSEAEIEALRQPPNHRDGLLVAA